MGGVRVGENRPGFSKEDVHPGVPVAADGDGSMPLTVQPEGEPERQVVEKPVAGVVKVPVLHRRGRFHDGKGHLDAEGDDRRHRRPEEPGPVFRRDLPPGVPGFGGREAREIGAALPEELHDVFPDRSAHRPLSRERLPPLT